MASKIVKRFIAGAVCPRCAKMDKLVMYNDDRGRQVRECVRCGYRVVMTDDGPVTMNSKEPIPEELVTRVNQPRLGEKPLAHEDEVQVVNILDPGAKRRDH
ncbi:MAG: YheV family putative zinc ribbon protein [Pseudomonadales bacterium]